MIRVSCFIKNKSISISNMSLDGERIEKVSENPLCDFTKGKDASARLDLATQAGVGSTLIHLLCFFHVKVQTMNQNQRVANKKLLGTALNGGLNVLLSMEAFWKMSQREAAPLKFSMKAVVGKYQYY